MQGKQIWESCFTCSCCGVNDNNIVDGDYGRLLNINIAIHSLYFQYSLLVIKQQMDEVCQLNYIVLNALVKGESIPHRHTTEEYRSTDPAPTYEYDQPF